MNSTLRQFLVAAFDGKGRRMLEACTAGGLAATSIAIFRKSLVDPPGSLDPRIQGYIYLQTFDPEIPFVCTELLRIVSVFAPHLVTIALQLSEHLDDMAVCCRASAQADKPLPDLAFTSYVLSHRITRIISDITVSFPSDSASRLKLQDYLQRLYEFQEDMNSEVKGYNRLQQLS